MRILIASDDSGSLKEVICNKNTDTSVKTALQPFHLEAHLKQGLNNRINKVCMIDQENLLLGRNNGVIELVSRVTICKEVEQDKSPNYDVSEFDVKDFIGGLFDQSSLDELSKKSKKRSPMKDEFVELYQLPGKDHTFMAACKSGSIIFFEADLETLKLKRIGEQKLRAPMEFVTLYDLNIDLEYDSYVFAYAGEENLVKLIQIPSDFGSVDTIWSAKNVAFDRLGLRVPAWDVALRFLQSSEKSVFKFMTITKYSHFRQYSTDQEDCRPINSVDLLPNREPLSSLLVLHNRSPLGNSLEQDFEKVEFLTTDIKHDVFHFSAQGRLLRKIGKGDISGYASTIMIKKNYLLQGGLDRYVRVFDLTSFRLIIKVFSGGKISALELLDDKELKLPLSQEEIKKGKKNFKRKLTADEHEVENDDLWEELENTSNKKKSRKM